MALPPSIGILKAQLAAQGFGCVSGDESAHNRAAGRSRTPAATSHAGDYHGAGVAPIMSELEKRQFDGAQSVRDWMAFEKVFREREGFIPHPTDLRSKTAFHYFTAGAHEEFMGRLNVK